MTSLSSFWSCQVGWGLMQSEDGRGEEGRAGRGERRRNGRGIRKGLAGARGDGSNEKGRDEREKKLRGT